ncbi:MAG: hypothetical protein FWG04_00080 [Desulfovibrionaceae bacterium]|nr:hypothetical protein [Desulfovibrionaceae bacterium]
MTNPHGAVVLSPTEQAEDIPEDQPGLEARIRELEAAIAACNAHTCSLMDQEDPAKGIFHAAAIHASKQRHMQLRYLKDICVARVSRLRA